MDSFFGIGLPELILILVIAGVVMGPERIAHIARWLGKTTAQLQSISRAFVQQLHNELDGIDDGEALKGAFSELQSLRQELETLKKEFVSTTNTATQAGQTAVDEISNSILPPARAQAMENSSTHKNGTDTAVSTNGTHPKPPTKLPTPIDIPSDPQT